MRVIRKQTYLTAWQDARIKRIAARRGVTEAEILREAVDFYLAQVEGEEERGGDWLADLLGAFTAGVPDGSEVVDEIYRRPF